MNITDQNSFMRIGESPVSEQGAWKAVRIGESAKYEIISDGMLVAITDDNHAAQIAAVPALIAALQDIREWCENAKRIAGVEPYGLAVANKALSLVTP